MASIIFIKLTNYSKKDLLLIRLIIFHKFLSIKIYKFAGFAETSFLKTSFDVGGQGLPALLFNLLSIIRNIILIEKYAKKINCMVVLMVQQRQQQHQHHCALFLWHSTALGMRPLIEEGPSKSSRAEELLEGSLPSIFVSFVDCFASQTEPTSFFMNGGGTLEVPSYYIISKF